MERKRSFQAVPALVAAAVVAAAVSVAARVARASDKHADEQAHLAGKWTFNKDQSDDAGQKVHDAEASTTMDRGGYPSGGGQGGGYPGGSGPYPGGAPYPGGGGIGYPGRGGMGGGIGGPMGGGGMGRPRRTGPSPAAGPSGEDLDQLAEEPKLLRIEQDDKQVTVTNDSGETKTLYPDGKKHKDADTNGRETGIKSHWDSGRLISEGKLGHSGKLTQTYELSHDGKQLVVISELEGSRLRAPLIIRSVFDTAATASTK